MGRFPESFLEELRLRADIVDVISSYIPLSRAGANFKALCPFHKEKTPSFFVSPQKQIYHCFGCGKGGNVFSFVMEYEKVSFPEAVEILASKYNMPIPVSDEKGRREKWNKEFVSNFYAINKAAMQYYHRKLFSKEGRIALEYLRERGVGIDTIKTFKIGFAGEDKEGFVKFALERGLKEQVLFACGIASKNSYGQVYDRMWGRIVFPVMDAQGRVVGFGGRDISGASSVKYLNTPETKVFRKSYLLYRLDLAKHYLQDRSIILVEGYMDVVSLFSSGIKNVVATLGTACGQEHVSILSRYVDRVYILYDADEAGFLASLRAVKLFLPSSLSVKVVVLPDGLDPDEYIRQYGKDNLLKKIAFAEDGFLFFMKRISEKYDLSDSKSKSLMLNELFDLIGQIQDSIIQSDYIVSIGRFLDIDVEVLRSRFIQFCSKRGHLAKGGEREEIVLNSPAELSVEKELIKLVILHPELRDEVSSLLKEDEIRSQELKEIWRYIVLEGCSVLQLLDLVLSEQVFLSDSWVSWLTSLEAGEDVDIEEILLWARDCIKRMRRKRRIEELKRRLQKEADDSVLLQLQEILRQEKEV